MCEVPHTAVQAQRPLACREQSGYAATWETGNYGTHAGNAGYIMQIVSERLDRFILEYLRVNETACR